MASHLAVMILRDLLSHINEPVLFCQQESISRLMVVVRPQDSTMLQVVSGSEVFAISDKDLSSLLFMNGIFG